MNEKRDVAKFDDMDLLARALATGDSGTAIEWQEKSGQQSFVGSDTLPTKIDDEGRAALEAAGVKFLGVVENDPMFQYVELPTGWKKNGTSHSMHSELLDEKGRKRAGIFYKAAFYDRSAHMYATRRFNRTSYHDGVVPENAVQAVVLDCDKVIECTVAMYWDESEREKRFELRDQVEAMAEAWLNEHYPDWRNAGAYWD